APEVDRAEVVDRRPADARTVLFVLQVAVGQHLPGPRRIVVGLRFPLVGPVDAPAVPFVMGRPVLVGPVAGAGAAEEDEDDQRLAETYGTFGHVVTFPNVSSRIAFRKSFIS